MEGFSTELVGFELWISHLSMEWEYISGEATVTLNLAIGRHMKYSSSPMSWKNLSLVYNE